MSMRVTPSARCSTVTSEAFEDRPRDHKVGHDTTAQRPDRDVAAARATETLNDFADRAT